MKEKWERLCENWFKGDITLPKVTLWLACAACLLAGIVYGLCKALWPQGVTIGSNNGNGCCRGCGIEDEDEAAQEV